MRDGGRVLQKVGMVRDIVYADETPSGTRFSHGKIVWHEYLRLLRHLRLAIGLHFVHRCTVIAGTEFERIRYCTEGVVVLNLPQCKCDDRGGFILSNGDGSFGKDVFSGRPET
jgi:hypothetical protein